MRDVFFIVGLCTGLLGCASIENVPVNQPRSGAGLVGKNPLYFEERSAEDEDVIGLSFSGGGTRAAAFSFGVLTEMARTPVRGASASMLDRIGFISGVIGRGGNSRLLRFAQTRRLGRLPRAIPAAQCRGRARDRSYH